MCQGIPDSLREVVDATVREAGMALFDMEHNGRTLQVFIESDQGVTIDACVRVSELLSARLDQSDLIQGRYFLEVSSPGLERKLRGIDDFARETGKLAHVVTAGGTIHGVIRRVEGGAVVMAVPAESGAEKEIVLASSDIRRANLKVPDKELFARRKMNGEGRVTGKRAGSLPLSMTENNE